MGRLSVICFVELLRELRRADANADVDAAADGDGDEDGRRFALAEPNDFLSALAPAQLCDAVGYVEVHDPTDSVLRPQDPWMSEASSEASASGAMEINRP